MSQSGDRERERERAPQEIPDKGEEKRAQAKSRGTESPSFSPADCSAPLWLIRPSRNSRPPLWLDVLRLAGAFVQRGEVATPTSERTVLRAQKSVVVHVSWPWILNRNYISRSNF